MNEPIDFQRARRARGSTSASSHPELVSGDFVVPPRPPVPPTALHRSVVCDRRRAAGGVLAIAAIAVLLSGVTFRSGATASDVERQKVAGTCLQWHFAASAVVSRQVQSTRDVDLVHLSNSIDRMRRARRNCELGEVAQACDDYHAVASSLPGHAMSNDLFPCAPATASVVGQR